jgi:pantetheine-phosphate adenylyltransferase
MIVNRIIGALPEERFTSWDELILRPELNAVFGEDSFVDVERLNERRFEIDGLFAVTYHPLSMYIEKRLSPDFKYFEDEKSDLTPQDTVILGGTFDHLHNGHKKLLSLAASICKRRVVVGVTAHSMLLKKSHVHLIEHVEKRKSKVHAYLSFLNPQLKIEVVTINDPFGPAITIEEPAALVVSTETIAGAVKINEIRQDRHLQRLQVYVCRRTEASTLSSSYIREKLAARGVRS